MLQCVAPCCSMYCHCLQRVTCTTAIICQLPAVGSQGTDELPAVGSQGDDTAEDSDSVSCAPLVCAARRCNTLPHAATPCHTLQHTVNEGSSARGTSLVCAATHCNTIRPTATYCNPLQPTLHLMAGEGSSASGTSLVCAATHCNPLQCTATHCNTLQHTATHCNTLQHFTGEGSSASGASLDFAATHYNTLRPTVTHCNTLQHTLQNIAGAGISSSVSAARGGYVRMHHKYTPHTNTLTHTHAHAHARHVWEVPASRRLPHCRHLCAALLFRAHSVRSLQYVAVFCRVVQSLNALQFGAVWCTVDVLQCAASVFFFRAHRISWCNMLQGGAGCCRVVQGVAGWCRVLPCVAVWWSVLAVPSSSVSIAFVTRPNSLSRARSPVVSFIVSLFVFFLSVSLFLSHTLSRFLCFTLLSFLSLPPPPPPPPPSPCHLFPLPLSFFPTLPMPFSFPLVLSPSLLLSTPLFQPPHPLPFPNPPTAVRHTEGR